MSQEIKEEIIIREPRDRMTQNFLNKFEVAEVLGRLATAIADGIYDEALENNEELTLNLPGKQDMNIEIAERMLEVGETHMKIRRKIGDNTYEEWDVDELVYYDT